MDDELEDEVYYQTLISHLRLLSRFVTVSKNNAMLNHLVRSLRFYLWKPETVAVALAVVVLLIFRQSYEVWYTNFLGRLLPAASKKLRLGDAFATGHRANLFMNIAGGGDWKGKTWELERQRANVYAIQGRRPRMEDRFSVLVDEDTGIALYGIFDGHGGESAAEFVEKTLFKTLLKKLQEIRSNHGSSSSNSNKSDASSPNNSTKTSNNKKDDKSTSQKNSNSASSLTEIIGLFAKLLTEEILAVDKRFMSLAKQVNDLAGTTALVAIVYQNQLIVANVGDSRGVICDSRGNAIPLSFDHKPQQIKERKRIKEAGGFITFHGVWRVAGILATSRALGDFPLKDRNLIIAEPDILTFNLTDLRPEFFVLASDGLWDEFSNEEAVAYLREHYKEQYHGAQSIATEAYKKGSVDNITVMVVDLKNLKSDKVQVPYNRSEE